MDRPPAGTTGLHERRPIRVFLLDDHEIVRRGVRMTLEDEPDIEVVGEADCAARARARIPALRPDVAILDVRLPDGSGIAVCREVRAVDPSIRALMLTSYDDDDAVLSAILAGASGFALKLAQGAELVTLVRKVASGLSALDPAVTERVLDYVRRRPQQGLSPLNRLSGQERRLLGLIGKGLTNREIAEEMSLAEKTVKNYVTGLLGKLDLASRTQAALFAAEHGAP